MAGQNEEPEVEIKIKAKKPTDIQSTPPPTGPPAQPQNQTGYDPLDLLKAPARPPTPQETPNPSYGQFLGIAVGVIVIMLGLAAWLLVGNFLPLLLVAVGAGVIAANTLYRPRK